MAIAGGKHRLHAGFTLLLPLVPERVEAAAALIEAFDRAPFETSTTTHFATITIIPAQTYEYEPLPATLLFATSLCGPVEDHVAELIAMYREHLRALFACCRDFDPRCDDTELAQFLVGNRHSDTFYSGMQHLTPRDVRGHRALRDAIQKYLDTHEHALVTKPALAIHAELRDHVKSDADLAWMLEPIERGDWEWPLRYRSYWLGIALLAIVALIPTLAGAAWLTGSGVLATITNVYILVVGAAVIMLLGLVPTIKSAEREQDYHSRRLPDAHVRALAATQNRPVINEFVIAGPIKNGALRPFVLRLALWVIARAVEGVPWAKPFRTPMHIPTVATARWIAADRGKRLVFISNYTHAAEPYVRDFIDDPGGATNINISFGFGRGYPPTSYIVNEGAHVDANGFVHVVTEHQQPRTLFWYGPYDNLTIDNIAHDEQIRIGLAKLDHDDASAREWLQLL